MAHSAIRSSWPIKKNKAEFTLEGCEFVAIISVVIYSLISAQPLGRG